MFCSTDFGENVLNFNNAFISSLRGFALKIGMSAN
jgi:hypothetical protein